MPRGLAVGIDLGTSGVRAALVDGAGDAVAAAAVSLHAAERRRPAALWGGVCAALARLAAGASLSDVRAVAVDGTSGTILAADAQGDPLGDASLYGDPAAPEELARVRAAAPPETAALGATSPLARLLALQRISGAAKVLHEADWIVLCLTGRVVSDSSNALKTGFDPRGKNWPDWVLAAGARRDTLPHVLAPGATVGPLTAAAAEATGLPREAVVVAGLTDGCAAFLATGAARPGDAVTSLGSTLTVKLLSERPVFSAAHGVYSHLVCGAWLAGGASNSGGAALLKHFSVAELVRLSERILPERDSGLDYYPLPAPGERFPQADPAMLPRETPRPADDVAFLHGLLEGIARIEAEGFRLLAELGATPARVLRTVGGGAGNPAWSRIRCRLLGLATAPARSEDAAVGTALLALRGVSGISGAGG